MKIRVTEEHIRDGLPHQCRRCPIALAIRDSVKGSSDITVGINRILFNIGDRKWSFDTPLDACNFIDDFDSRKSVEPFEFVLDFTPGS